MREFCLSWSVTDLCANAPEGVTAMSRPDISALRICRLCNSARRASNGLIGSLLRVSALSLMIRARSLKPVSIKES